MERVVLPSAARAAADELREEILRRPAGYWLGSEEDVLLWLGVSRPTLRQAARILEAEQLLVVKRGLNGGLFTRKPTAEGVAHIASVFLRSEGTTLLDLGRTFYVLLTEIARLAAAHPDPDVRAGLLDWVREQDLGALRGDRRAFAKARIEFSRRLTGVAGSTTMRLFVDVLWELGRDRPGLFMDRKQMDLTITHWQQVAEAVRDGEEQTAVDLMRENATVVIEWLEEHLKDRRFG